ncbi:MAG: glycosyltransferase [Deltaproteobacteria bacterium]|nr:glycosyltransferase [Deltaproteobacteria bacterium]
MNKINVLHIIPGLGIGGAEKVVLGLHQFTDQEHFKTRIIHWGEQHAMQSQAAFSDQAIIQQKLDKVFSVDTIRKLIRVVRDNHIDIIQTHLIDADLLGFVVSLLTRKPVIITIHSYPFPTETRHGLRYRLISFFDSRFICVSYMVKDHFGCVTGIEPDRIDVLHNGIHLAEFSKEVSDEVRTNLRRYFSIPGDHNVVGTVARLIEDKGHRYLLLAVPRIIEAHPNTTFLIIGDGELKPTLIAMCEDLNIQKHVIFTGSRTDIPDLLEIMDIFVYPTFREALGIAVIEAMATGKAIVATDDASIPELITSGKEGMLIHPGDPQGIAAAVIDLLASPKKRQTLGKAAKQKAAFFSIDLMARKMEEIYRQVFAQSP